MASETALMQLAATKLGAGRITSRTDVDSLAARTFDAVYDQLRDAELRRRLWRFSLARVQLSALTDAPVFGYAYAYQLPTDCLRVVQVGEFWSPSLSDYRNSDESLFSLEGRQLLTELSAPLSLRYVKKIDNAQLFDAAFFDYMANVLAFHTCAEITGSDAKKERLGQDVKDALESAVMANAIEVPPSPLPDDTWITARL